jgi:hypothetical protein
MLRERSVSDPHDEVPFAELANIWDEWSVNPGVSAACGLVAVGMLFVVIGIILSGAF